MQVIAQVLMTEVLRQCLFIVLLFALLLHLGKTSAAQTPVSIELVLAIDTSASVDDTEFSLQLNGIAAAFRSQEVVNLIVSQKGVAVTLIQWSGLIGRKHSVPWSLLSSPASIAKFASEVETVQRESVGHLTAIGNAINGALELIRTNSFSGKWLKIDISGDGQSNDGIPLTIARLRAQDQNVTINGLAVRTDEANLDDYYRRNVITGAGAFVVTASSYEDFARAIRLKLLRELASEVSRTPGLSPEENWAANFIEVK